MNPFVKVCGIQTAEEAHGALNAGANALGFLIGLTHKAEDKIQPDKAKKIIQSLPDDVNTVIVTHLIDEKEIADLAAFTGVRTIQVHDALPVAGMIRLRQYAPGKTLIKAIHVMDDRAHDDAEAYKSCADMLLLDSRTKDRLGGTGMTHDWDISAAIVRGSNVPVILAGGLNPENALSAINKVHPAGIDANSGLEHADGSKDFNKIRLFAEAGRNCRFEKTNLRSS